MCPEFERKQNWLGKESDFIGIAHAKYTKAIKVRIQKIMLSGKITTTTKERRVYQEHLMKCVNQLIIDIIELRLNDKMNSRTINTQSGGEKIY